MVPSVRIVVETGEPVAQIARDLGVNEGTLGNWVNRRSGRPDGTPHRVGALPLTRRPLSAVGSGTAGIS